MKAFIALFADLAMATSLPSPASPGVQRDLGSTLKDLHDLVVHTNHDENQAVFEYKYKPGIDFLQVDNIISGNALLPRALSTQVNVPGVGERVTVALRLASVTLIRIAAETIRVEVDNIQNYAVKVLLNWVTGSESDKVPASATVHYNIDLQGHENGQITVATSAWS